MVLNFVSKAFQDHPLFMIKDLGNLLKLCIVQLETQVSDFNVFE